MAERKTAKKAKTEDRTQDRIIDAAMDLFATQGWADTRLSDIAEAAEVPLAELHQYCRSKLAILALFSREMDRRMVLDDDPEIADEPVKDRLFDVIMRRLDAMAPYRKGVAQIVQAMRRRPQLAAFMAAGPMRCSLDWMLEAARVPSWGPLHGLQRKGLGLIYLNSLRIWLKDDGEEMGKTMAALDKDLKRVDSVIGRGGGMLRKRRKQAAADEEAGSDTNTGTESSTGE